MEESQWKLLLVEDNPIDSQLIRGMLADADHRLFEVEAVDSMVAALNALTQGRFDVVLLDLSLPDSSGLETLLTIQRHAPGMPIVLLTGLESESLAMTTVAHGAQDYLVKGDLTPETLLKALRYAVIRGRNQGEVTKSPPEKAKITGILGCKGGVGVTTIACHFAEELKRQSGKSVLLVDLDPSAASAAFLMKPQSEYTADDATVNLHRLDNALWKRLACATSGGVDLLQSPGVMHFGHQLTGERVRHVLRYVRGLYSHIVVDLGVPNALSLALLEETNELLVVSTCELPSFYEFTRLTRRLLDLGIPRTNLKTVVNRASKALSYSTKDLERAIGCPVFALIGDYTAELHEAYANGRFLGSKLRIRRDIVSLAAKSLGFAEYAPPKSGWNLFRSSRGGTHPAPAPIRNAPPAPKLNATSSL